jgi:signal transduction histidine kinase
MDEPLPSFRPLRAFLIAAIFASIPAGFITLGLASRGMPVLPAFLIEGLPWYLWAAFTPVIFWLARRYPVDGRGWAFARHTAFGLAAGLIGGLVAAGIAASVTVPAELATEASPAWLIVVWVPFGLVMYAAIASVGFALDYHRRLRERERAAARLERLLVESRLGALRMQLQPHFLFNALNTVSMLVREGSDQTAVRVIARLGDLLRQVLDEEAAQEVTLGEELDLVGRYLEIEQVRFGDRLQVSVDADEQARRTAVPHLLLQPLVENAVHHGISRRADATRIDISARRENGRLHIAVQDDGPGLPDGWTLAGSAGIGLRNTSERLQYLYGDAASLELHDTGGTGARVRVVLPAPDQ